MLKTVADLEDFNRFKQGLKPKGTVGRGAKIPSQVDSLRWASAHGLQGLPSIQSGRADLASGRWNMTAIAEALTRIGVDTTRQQIRWQRSLQQPATSTDPDPEMIKKLKTEIRTMEAEMNQKQSGTLGLVDTSGIPRPADRSPEISEQNHGGNGYADKVVEVSYRGSGIVPLSNTTLREVRNVASMLSISRLKFDRAIARYRKRMNGDDPLDPVTIAINALAVAAFGAENTAQIIELINIERRSQDNAQPSS